MVKKLSEHHGLLDVTDAALFVERKFQKNLLPQCSGVSSDICTYVSTYTVSHPGGPISSAVRASNIARNFLIYGL
jgi:hypothetical protein